VTDEQLAAERRRGRFASVASIFAGLAFAGGAYWYQFATRDQPDENKADILRYFHAHDFDLLASSLLQGLGMILICFPAYHLYRAARDRNPEQANVVLVMGVLGPLAFATTLFLRSIALTVLASDFVDRPSQTLSAARDAFDSPAIRVSEGLGIVGALALGFWFVKGSLDFMRLGLLGRFMGVVGIALGPALVLGFGLLVMPIWLIALGVLFMGWWPGGLPPAWVTGRAQPWESLREPAARPDEPAELGGERNGDVEAIGPGVRKGSPDEERGPPA
jgi:MFS family permease